MGRAAIVSAAIALSLAAGWAVTGAAVAAQPSPPEACMAPIPAGAPDPVARNVHFHVGDGSTLMSITMCVASREARPLQGVAANVGIFDKDGVLINYAGQSYRDVLPLENPSGDGPKLVLLYGVAVQVDGKYNQQFASSTVVALTTVSCTKPLPDCAPAAPQTSTFLLPVQIDHDLPGAKK
jgi:hypothetical protein